MRICYFKNIIIKTMPINKNKPSNKSNANGINPSNANTKLCGKSPRVNKNEFLNK